MCVCEVALNICKSLGASKYPLTIYFLIDVRVVYILTFAYITAVNLISSTASIHASADKSKTTQFDVSSKYMNVNVTSINDAVLWNCRKLSPNSNYYKSLYKTMIITMAVLLAGYFLIKVFALLVISNNFGCKCCKSCRDSSLKHGLTKLWHMAIHQKLVDLLSRSQKAGTEKYSSNDAVAYDKLLDEKIRSDIAKKVNKWNNCCRLIIPYILLFLLVAILCMAYLSFDLHPLACILEPEEELITYKENSVELKFSFSLLIFQKVVAIIVFCLAIGFAICLRLFFYFTKEIIDNLKQHVADEIRNCKEKLGTANAINAEESAKTESIAT